MSASSNILPNTYDIAEALVDAEGTIPGDALFQALQQHWTDDGSIARIEEAVSDGVLIEAPVMRYRLGTRKGLPDPSRERSKLNQLDLIKTLLGIIEMSEQECYCIHCFYEFCEEMHDETAPIENPVPQSIN